MYETSSRPISPASSFVNIKVSKQVRETTKNEQIPPSFFSNISVFLNLKKEELSETAKIAIRAAGGRVVTKSPFLADVCITDSPIDLMDPSLNRTRGSRLASNASSREKKPKIIQYENVKWISYNPIDRNVSWMIVADCECKCRPEYRQISDIPQIFMTGFHFPRGYTFSPFSKPPEDIEAAILKRQKLMEAEPVFIEGPTNNGYCEVCGEDFLDPVIHRKSKRHLEALKKPIFEKIDLFSLDLLHKFYHHMDS